MRKAVIEVVFDRDHVEEGVPDFLFWHARLACAPHRWFGRDYAVQRAASTHGAMQCLNAYYS